MVCHHDVVIGAFHRHRECRFMLERTLTLILVYGRVTLVPSWRLLVFTHGRTGFSVWLDGKLVQTTTPAAAFGSGRFMILPFPARSCFVINRLLMTMGHFRIGRVPRCAQKQAGDRVLRVLR